VSWSYGTFLEHPISARSAKLLPANWGATFTRQKMGPAAMVISCLDTPKVELVATNFSAASLGSGFEK
jgi:hypothetical protein